MWRKCEYANYSMCVYEFAINGVCATSHVSIHEANMQVYPSLGARICTEPRRKPPQNKQHKHHKGKYVQNQQPITLIILRRAFHHYS